MTDLFNNPPSPALYGAQWAADYDALEAAPVEHTTATITTLERLADGGPVLVVAAATGRVAIPLARRGIDVTATDASPDMLKRLIMKDTDKLVRTKLEVLPEIAGNQQYAAITILVNSLWVLQSVREQQLFLHNAAAHLLPDGVLVIEMGVVDTARWAKPHSVRRGGFMITRTTLWNPKTGNVRHRFTFEDGVDKTHASRDVYLRYVMPEELLNMATAAGLRPRHLWEDWNGTPFDTQSNRIIAVLESQPG